MSKVIDLSKVKLPDAYVLKEDMNEAYIDLFMRRLLGLGIDDDPGKVFETVLAAGAISVNEEDASLTIDITKCLDNVIKRIIEAGSCRVILYVDRENNRVAIEFLSPEEVEE